MKKLLLGWRMGGVASSDPLWFVVPDWLKVVNMKVTAVGSFVLTVSGMEAQFGLRGHRAD